MPAHIRLQGSASIPPMSQGCRWVNSQQKGMVAGSCWMALSAHAQACSMCPLPCRAAMGHAQPWTPPAASGPQAHPPPALHCIRAPAGALAAWISTCGTLLRARQFPGRRRTRLFQALQVRAPAALIGPTPNAQMVKSLHVDLHPHIRE